MRTYLECAFGNARPAATRIVPPCTIYTYVADTSAWTCCQIRHRARLSIARASTLSRVHPSCLPTEGTFVISHNNATYRIITLLCRILRYSFLLFHRSIVEHAVTSHPILRLSVFRVARRDFAPRKLRSRHCLPPPPSPCSHTRVSLVVFARPRARAIMHLTNGVSPRRVALCG